MPIARFGVVTTLVLATLLFVNSAHAGLIGADVQASATVLQPTSSVTESGASTTVGPGVEYPLGSFADYSESIDITDNQIIITTFTTSATGYDPALFNGFVLAFGIPILSAAPDVALSDYLPVTVSIGPDNVIQLNYEGVSGITNGQRSVIDIETAAVPEPASLTLFGVPLIMFLRARRRRAA